MNRVILMVGLLVFAGVFVTGLSLPFVDAKPNTDKDTGITVHCKVIQGEPSCDVIERKNGIYQILLTNAETKDHLIEGGCDQVISTEVYDFVIEQGQTWTFEVTDCTPEGNQGDTSIFQFVLNGNRFDII